jgi:hypothetical protein
LHFHLHALMFRLPGDMMPPAIGTDCNLEGFRSTLRLACSGEVKIAADTADDTQSARIRQSNPECRIRILDASDSSILASTDPSNPSGLLRPQRRERQSDGLPAIFRLKLMATLRSQPDRPRSGGYLFATPGENFARLDSLATTMIKRKSIKAICLRRSLTGSARRLRERNSDSIRNQRTACVGHVPKTRRTPNRQELPQSMKSQVLDAIESGWKAAGCPQAHRSRTPARGRIDQVKA